MNRGWLWVAAGGLAETSWAVCMKLSDGFTDPLYDVLFVAMLFVSLALLNRGFRAGLPTGPCYAVWTGIGAVGSVIAGTLLFGEALNLAGWACIALVVGGVAGLNLVSDGADRGHMSRPHLPSRSMVSS